MSYTFVDNIDMSRGVLKTILDGDNRQPLYVDIETTGLDWFTDKILLFQVMYKDEIYIFDIRKLGYDILKEFLQWTSTFEYVIHNSKFELKFFYDKTNVIHNNVFDTMICEVILEAGKGQQLYSLDYLVTKYTDFFMDKSVREEFINYPDDRPFTEKMLNYSALDVLVLKEIRDKQLDRVKKNGEKDVVDLDMKLLPVVAKMEYDGISMSTEEWKKLKITAEKQRKVVEEDFKNLLAEKVFSNKFENGLKLAEAVKIPVKTLRLTNQLLSITDVNNIRGWFMENFNINSYLQMVTALNLIGIKAKNTNEKTLLDFIEHDEIEMLLELRALGKQITSYGENFLELIHPVTKKIHTEYFTCGTRTGRFSSNNPNMQQIPIKGGYRECFIPTEDHVFISLDYSQQEYRLAGALSKERAIINAYKNGWDMHTATAALQFNKSLEEVTSDERNLGKTLNFAILYGSTEYGLKRNLRVPLDKAKEIIDNFWRGYPNLKRFNDMVGEKILELGYSSTPLGRRRYNAERPAMADSKTYVKWRERVLREGRNLIIQGGGADILKIAMVNIFNKNPFGNRLKLLLQIHDELLAEVHVSIKNEAFEFIKKEMEEAEQPFLGEIPAVVEGKIKERWSK